MNSKVAIIGAGSAYTPIVLESFVARAKTWSGATLTLQDPATEHMEIVYQLGKHMAEAAGANLILEKTTDLDAALTGADFVLTTFRISGLDGLDIDEQVPTKYGMVGDETQGPGGIFMAFRTLPAVHALVKKMEKLCPNAWLINYTNPTHYIADMIKRVSPVKSISLCDGFTEAFSLVSQTLKVPVESIEAMSAGINHCTWVLQCRVDGKDAYPLLKEKAPGMKGSFDRWQYDLAVDLMGIFGYLPSPINHMLPYYWRDEYLNKVKDGSYQSLGKRLRYATDNIWGYLAKMAKEPKPKIDWTLPATLIYGSRYHGDLAVNVMDAIVNDTNKMFIVNIPNKGLVDNLPDGAIVEIPARVGKKGYVGVPLGQLPKGVVGLIQDLIAAEELTVDAYLAHDKDKALQAMIANPLTTSFVQSKLALDELMAKHKPFLVDELGAPLFR